MKIRPGQYGVVTGSASGLGHGLSLALAERGMNLVIKAKVALLPGLGHWWMIQDPVGSAAALRTFWNSL